MPPAWRPRKDRSTEGMSRAHLALHRHDVDVEVACCAPFLRLHYLPQCIREHSHDFTKIQQDPKRRQQVERSVP